MSISVASPYRFRRSGNVVDPDLVYQIPCTEGTGTVAADISGNGWDATLEDGTGWNAATCNGGPFALDFDGVNDYASILPGANVSLVPGITVMCFMFINSLPVADVRMVSKAVGAAEGDHFYMLSMVNATGSRLRARIKTLAGTTTIISLSNTISLSTCYHIAVTANTDTDRIILYLDGLEIQNNPLPVSGGILGSVVTPTAIGAQPPGAGGKFFDGRINDVRLYSRTLTPAEIFAIGG